MTRLLFSVCSLAGALAVLTGCASGPSHLDRGAVTSVTPDAFTNISETTLKTEPAGNWWQAYSDPVLDRLMSDAQANNLDIKQAAARVRQARADLRSERAGLWPSASIKENTERQQTAIAAFGIDPKSLGIQPKPLNLYDAEFDSNWELDLFGGQKMAARAAKATAEEAAARLEDTRVTLLADVASTYIDLRGAQLHLLLIDEDVASARSIVELTKQRLAQGTASQLDDGRAMLQLEMAGASRPLIQTQIVGDRAALAILTGRTPETLDLDLLKTTSLPTIAGPIFVGDPSATLRRRPDVRAAEHALAAEAARIGVATADLFPKVTFVGNYGYGATDLSQVGRPEALTFALGPSISWNFLNFGRVRAGIASANASADASFAQYQQSILIALRDTETSLARFSAQSANVDTLSKAREISVRNAELARQQYVEGTSSQLDLLDAERQRLQTEESLLEARVALSKDYASLGKALGFSWPVSSPSQ